MAEDMQLQPGIVFDFTVADPQKKAGGLGHWVYHIYTKTSHEKFRHNKCTAVRRYSDFDWLRKQLIEEYPGCIIPPIPEKTIGGTFEKLTGGSDPSALVEYRSRSMRKFLVRVGAHVKVCNSHALQDFLQLSEEEFARRLKEPGKKSLEDELGLGSRLKEMFGKADCPEAKQWNDRVEYFQRFQASLEQLKERFSAVVARRKELGLASDNFGKAFIKAGESEALHEKSTLSNSMCDIGKHAEHMGRVYEEWGEQDVVLVVESVNYYIGLCQSAQQNTKRLQRLISAHHAAEESVKALMKKRDGAAEDARAKLDAQVKAREEDRDKIRAAEEEYTVTFKEELQRFHSEKSYDMKALLRSFSELQNEYAGRMRTSWDSLLPTVEAIKAE